MEFMLDTLNINEIKKWARVLPLAGVTSNPTIAKKEGEIDFFKRIHEVREIIGEAPSIHVQVVAKDYDGILTLALPTIVWYYRLKASVVSKESCIVQSCQTNHL